MLFEFIMLLTLITFVVSQLLLVRFISKNLRKDRELTRERDYRILQMFKGVQVIASDVAKTQISLDEKMNALSSYVDERNTYVTFQQEQFKSIAKADMLNAQRNELARTKEAKAALERLVTITTMSRQPVETTDRLALESATKRIKELEALLELDS